MKRLLLAITVCLLSLTTVSAQEVAPELEYVMELKVVCSQAFSAGTGQHGERVIIPITGGTFEGPAIKGTVIPGGADYQYADKERGRTELEAIYCIRTDDGVNIHIRNAGILYFNNGQFYFRTAPKFDAPADSKYAWLNNAIFVCVPEVKKDYISLKVWKVK